jgi:hypothetical protein
VRGGSRKGAGRKTLFPGKTERITISVTPSAVRKANEISAFLMAQNAGIPVSISDAFEEAIGAYRLSPKKKK